MPRMARVVLPGVPLHITQRGVRRSNVFLDDRDHEIYLDMLQESSREFSLRICAYCLMTNHVHIVGVPDRPDSVARTFQRCHGMYATYFNKKYGMSGHAWQGRPFSCMMDEPHFWAAIRYVERNPVRAGIVARAEDYRWSSAPAHCAGAIDSVLDEGWATRLAIENWSEWLHGTSDVKTEDSIRKKTFTGRPCGDDAFVKVMEVALQRELAPKKSGPKPRLYTHDGRLLWTKDET
jgi:putative transposase